MKKTTLKDIAEMAGVSSACVSMILNGRDLHRFSEETIQKVYQASREAGYIPKKQKFHKNPKKIILIICPSQVNPYYAILIQSMEQEARSRGYMTLVYSTYWNKDSEKEALKLSEEPYIAGIIFAMIPQQPELAESIGRHVPMVSIGDKIVDLQIDTVDVNNYQSGRMIADHLVEMGHKHIAFISTVLNDEHTSRQNRCRGLQDRYRESCPEGTVTVYSEEASAVEQGLKHINAEHEVGYAMTNKCLANSPEVTAIVTANDMVAYGARAALIEAGKRIPEDISLCGFDNIYPSRFYGVGLTSIDHSIVDRGRNCIRMLARKMNDASGQPLNHAILRVEYQSRLVVGESSGPAKA